MAVFENCHTQYLIFWENYGNLHHIILASYMKQVWLWRRLNDTALWCFTVQCGLWQGFTDASLRCSGDRWEDDTPVCSSPQSDLIILCRNTDPKLCEVIFIADIQKLFHFLWYTRVALDDSVILYLQLSISPFRDKSVQVHSYNLNLSLPICHSPKIYYLSNIYQILSHSFCSFWPMIQRSLFIFLKRSSKKEV